MNLDDGLRARIAELETNAAIVDRCHKAKLREASGSLDFALGRIKALQADCVEYETIHRADQVILNSYEEAIEEGEEEIVAERARSLAAEVRVEELEEELREAKEALGDMKDERDDAREQVVAADGEAKDLRDSYADLSDVLADYLLSIGLPITSMRRPTRELQALCDAIQ